MQGFFHLPPVEKKNGIKFWHVLFGFLIYIGIQFALPVALLKIWPQSLLTRSAIGALMISMWLISWLALFYFWKSLALPLQKEIVGQEDRPWAALGLGAVSYLLANPLTLLAQALITLWFLITLGTYSPQTQVAVAHLQAMRDYPVIFFMTWVCFACVVPMIEEFLFRGLLQQWLRSKLASRPLALVLTALCFAAIHFSRSQGEANYELIPTLFVLGLLLCFLREKRSLFASIGLHATFNTVSLAYIAFA
jgi:hypothetical protein